MQSFILPANGAATPKSIERRRKMAEAMLAQGADYSPIASPWQGAARMANALVGGLGVRKADKQEAEGTQAARDAMIRALNGGDKASLIDAASNQFMSDAGMSMIGSQWDRINQPPEPPKTRDYIQGNQRVTEEWNGSDWVPLAQGDAFKMTPDSVVNVGGADGNFDKELSKGIAGVYTSAMEAGQSAGETKSAVQQLRVLLKGRGGALDGLSATIAPYLPDGAIPEGADDLVAARAIISGLIPKQRVPGAGPSSDFDARKFAESLPSIWNQPGGNEIILNTMESYADYRIAVSNIVADVGSNPDIKNKAAAIREQIAKIPDPFIGWKQYMAVSAANTKKPPEGADPELEDALSAYPD